MSDDKNETKKELVDSELDDLLDSALQDMTKKDDKMDNKSGGPLEDAQNPQNMWSEEFIKEAASQFEANMAAILGSFSGIPEEQITQEQIAQTFTKMAGPLRHEAVGGRRCVTPPLSFRDIQHVVEKTMFGFSPDSNSQGRIYLWADWAAAQGPGVARGPQIPLKKAAAQVLNQKPGENGTDETAGSGESALEPDRVDEVTAAISQTLQNLSTNAENLQTPFTDQDLANMFNNFNLEGGQEGNMFVPFMQGMMQSLLSKEVLYPSLKELVDKYPVWLQENKGKIEQADHDSTTLIPQCVRPNLPTCLSEVYTQRAPPVSSKSTGGPPVDAWSTTECAALEARRAARGTWAPSD
ncbi:Peroxisomal biogenesis factor 19 [Eumeta japonica]|uniref:Peroxin-19 n=1 Tax=Eumeta variegata TaxID=151549 RepID=A0A4C1X6Q8_EUMVA|nr:Peroxisomal biogenesis factor 19 [Eumeta japonica]